MQANILPLGKWRRLQQATTEQGIFTILAIDHRGPLRRALAKQLEAAAIDPALALLKQDIVRNLAPESSAVLLDPEVGLVRCITDGALPGATGLLVALDTGSTGDPAVLQTSVVAGWSAEKAVAVGAAGVKLLVYYHPDAPEARAIEEQVATVGAACARAQIPFYLEPLGYSPEQPGRTLPSALRRKVVVETARRLVPLGVDVLKAEFPVNIAEETNERIWREACSELNQVCPVPWVLLSGGVTFELFLRQTAIACEAGASGVIAGRAVWNEAVTLDLATRRQFLQGISRERMHRLRVLCEALASPFTARCQARCTSDGTWLSATS